MAAKKTRRPAKKKQSPKRRPPKKQASVKRKKPRAKKKAPVAKRRPSSRKVAAPRRPKAARSAPRAKSTAARDAREALAKKRAIRSVLAPVPDGKEVVDAYMRDLDHPFKEEIEAVRRIILGASNKLRERIKWNAPSFFYKEDLAAFHPRSTEYAHLILLFPGGVGIPEDGDLLEGKHVDRREAKFHGMSDVAAKKPALEKLVRAWIAQRDA
jgi:hypothetical protein